jgi:hypothetical protein
MTSGYTQKYKGGSCGCFVAAAFAVTPLSRLGQKYRNKFINIVKLLKE